VGKIVGLGAARPPSLLRRFDRANVAGESLRELRRSPMPVALS